MTFPPQTPPYWPTATQTPPQHQGGNPQFSQPQMPQQQMPQQQMPQQQFPGQMPLFHAPDEQAVQQQLGDIDKRAQDRQSQGGDFARFIRVPGPQGQVKWDAGVPIGYVGHVDVYLCGGWAAGVVMPMVECVTHFVKSMSNPKGFNITCSNDENCMFCQAKALAIQSPDPSIQQSAASWGRKRYQTLYNVLDLTNPQSHYGNDGIMRPYILGAGSQLQSDLKRMFDARGGVTIFCHPTQGRPIRVTKKKTGPNERDVEWGAIDLNPMPLDQYFYPALQNLWDLSQRVQPSKPEDIQKVIMELRWPMPGAMQAQAHAQPQAPMSFNPAPQPPYPNPYGSPPMPPAGMATAGTVPPPPPGMAPAPSMPPPPQQQFMPPPPQMAPQPPQQGMAPPPPPPVTSDGQGIPPLPQQQPGMGAPPPPPQPQGAPPQGAPPQGAQPPPPPPQPGAAMPPPPGGNVPF